MNQIDELDELIESGRSESRKREAYESACATVSLGHLCSSDVCRLWSERDQKVWRESPGTEARRLVRTLGLPLLELGQGRWVVSHALGESSD